MHLQLDSVLNAQALSVFEASSHGLEMYAQCSAYMQDCQLLKCVGSAVFAFNSGAYLFCVCVCVCVCMCVCRRVRDCQLLKCVGSAVFAFDSGAYLLCVCVCVCVYVCVQTCARLPAPLMCGQRGVCF